MSTTRAAFSTIPLEKAMDEIQNLTDRVSASGGTGYQVEYGVHAKHGKVMFIISEFADPTMISIEALVQ